MKIGTKILLGLSAVSLVGAGIYELMFSEKEDKRIVNSVISGALKKEEKTIIVNKHTHIF